MFKAQKIRLLSKEIVKGAELLVGTFRVPTFVVMPDSVTWRDRTFNRTDTQTIEPDGTVVAHYEESFSFVIGDYVEPIEGKSRGVQVDMKAAGQ